MSPPHAPLRLKTWRRRHLVVKWVAQFSVPPLRKLQRAESLASTLSGGFTMKGHIPFQQDITVGLFAVMLLVVLACVPLINYLVNFWFPGN